MIAVWAVLIIVGFLGATAFIGLYAARSRDWYHSPVGRNLMAMAVVLAGLLALSALGLLMRVWPWLWLGGMAALDVVLWWRVLLLWRVQHADRST